MGAPHAHPRRDVGASTTTSYVRQYIELTLGTGIFWLLLASTVGATIVRSARAIGRRAGKARDTSELERRVAELEGALTRQLEAQHEQDEVIDRLREQLRFTEQLVARRPAPRLEE